MDLPSTIIDVKLPLGVVLPVLRGFTGTVYFLLLS